MKSPSSRYAAQAAAERGLWTTQQLVKATGLTYRILDYYTRNGLVKPVIEAVGSGTARLWDPSVADELLDLRRRIEACPFHPHGLMKNDRPAVGR